MKPKHLSIIAKKEFRGLFNERTILLAVLLQLFIAMFSSFLMVGLTSMYDPSSLSKYSRSRYSIAYAGNESQLLTNLQTSPDFRVYQMDLSTAVAALKERKLAAEYENLEKQLYLTEQFTRSKVRLLEDRINSRFKLARFKMFNALINGGIEECCEVLYEGVPYSTALNNSARINVGLDIINALSDHYKFSAPIFVDNAEAVTQLLDTSGQQIRLYVSSGDKALRIEAS